MLELLLNLDNIAPAKAATFPLRVTARAVLFDVDNKIALLKIASPLIYKLPGGRIESGETIAQGLMRECREEAGCDIRIGRELGAVREIKSDKKSGSLCRQTTHAYIAEVVGEKHSPIFTPNEIRDGFALIWVPLDEAIEKVSSMDPAGPGKFIRARELAILEDARGS